MRKPNQSTELLWIIEHNFSLHIRQYCEGELGVWYSGGNNYNKKNIAFNHIQYIIIVITNNMYLIPIIIIK